MQAGCQSVARGTVRRAGCPAAQSAGDFRSPAPRVVEAWRRSAASMLVSPAGRSERGGRFPVLLSAAPRRPYARTARYSEGGAGCRARHPTAGAVPGDAAFAGEKSSPKSLRIPLATSGPRAPALCAHRNRQRDRELARATTGRRRIGGARPSSSHTTGAGRGVARPQLVARAGSWNCSSSVDPFMAMEEDRPLVTISVIWSKYGTPTNSWCRTAS